jgi:hypothetical protein
VPTLKNFYRSPFSKWPPQQHFDNIGQCWIFTAHFLCRVLADISKILKTQNCSCNGDLSLCQILCLHHSQFDMWVDIDSRHWKIFTGRHFQNGHHNTAKIQHCPISSKFDIWVAGHHYLPTYNILIISDNVEFLPPIFYAVFWQTSRKFWKRRIAPLMVTYH